MRFPNDFWEPIIAAIILVVGAVIYSISTRNRGSFTDTPDWSKVVRRIIELVCVFVSVLLVSYIGWSDKWYISLLLIFFPMLGVITVPFVVLIFRIITKRSIPSSEKMGEHLTNAIILTLFLLSGMLIVLITLAKALDQMAISIYLHIILSFLLSLELAFLAYQLYYYLIIKNIPNSEDEKAARKNNELDEKISLICKELNE